MRGLSIKEGHWETDEERFARATVSPASALRALVSDERPAVARAAVRKLAALPQDEQSGRALLDAAKGPHLPVALEALRALAGNPLYGVICETMAITRVADRPMVIRVQALDAVARSRFKEDFHDDFIGIVLSEENDRPLFPLELRIAAYLSLPKQRRPNAEFDWAELAGRRNGPPAALRAMFAEHGLCKTAARAARRG